MYWCLRFHYLNIAVLIILLLRILSDYPSSSWWVLFLFHISQSQNHVRNFPETTNYWHTDWNCYWLAHWLTNLFINSQTHWLSDGRSITQTSLFFPKRSFPQGKHSPAIMSEWPDYLPAFCDLFLCFLVRMMFSWRAAYSYGIVSMCFVDEIILTLLMIVMNSHQHGE